jgi:hypothetical protein
VEGLEGVDGFDGGEVVAEPFDAGFGFAITKVFEEVGNLVLAEGAGVDGGALDEGDLEVVFAAEQEDFPFLFIASKEG